MSAVSAVLTVQQQTAIRSVRENYRLTLRLAYNSIPEQTWDTCFSTYIDRLKVALNPYLDDLEYAMGNGEIAPGDPVRGLNEALNELTTGRLVDLITYSNAHILNQLKNYLVFQNRLGVSASTLGIISDGYVHHLGNQPRIRNPQHVGLLYQPYILEVARLYSMNKAMSNRINRIYRRSIPPKLINRFHNYQNSIIGLHREMARYLKIQTLRPYDRTCDSLDRELDQLRNSAYAPERIPEFQSAVTDLSSAIQSMIVINGVSSTPGTEVVFRLLDEPEHWDIRRKMCMGFDSTLRPGLVSDTIGPS
jgi:hypothetical protein